MKTEKDCRLDCSEELIRKGLERSCESLGFFLKEKVELETLAFSDTANSDGHPAIDGAKDIILFSEIIGQLKGQCYFMLDQHEAEFLFKKNYTASSGNSVQKPIFDAFLLELDNIITAAVVTEFANFLRIKLFGGIPEITYRSEQDKLAALEGRTTSDMYTYNFQCQYKIRGIKFNPTFYWVLEEKFAELVNVRQS